MLLPHLSDQKYFSIKMSCSGAEILLGADSEITKCKFVFDVRHP